MLNGVSLDSMLDYVSGSTSTLMCFIIPFVIYYKLIEQDPRKKHERLLYLSLIVVFSVFQVYKIISFFI